VTLTNVQEIANGLRAFAAIKEDGQLISWSARLWRSVTEFGSDLYLKQLSDNGEIRDAVQLVANGDGGYLYYAAFAALRSNGEVVTWGSSLTGGNPIGVDLTNIKSLYAAGGSFAAIKNDGSVVIWRETGNVVSSQVKVLTANQSNYAAINMDGVVSYWNEAGENISNQMEPITEVKEIIAGTGSFTALREDGSVYTWGCEFNGNPGYDKIIKVFKPLNRVNYCQDSYAGLDENGNVFIWGNMEYVGNVPSEELVPKLIELSNTLHQI
jgi:alpha-tubulin suppressor-like RCC1 family protein